MQRATHVYALYRNQAYGFIRVKAWFVDDSLDPLHISVTSCKLQVSDESFRRYSVAYIDFRMLEIPAVSLTSTSRLFIIVRYVEDKMQQRIVTLASVLQGQMLVYCY